MVKNSINTLINKTLFLEKDLNFAVGMDDKKVIAVSYCVIVEEWVSEIRQKFITQMQMVCL